MNGFEFLIQSLDLQYFYCKARFKEAKTFEKQTWYKAKIGMLDGLRNMVLDFRKEFELNDFSECEMDINKLKEIGEQMASYFIEYEEDGYRIDLDKLGVKKLK